MQSLPNPISRPFSGTEAIWCHVDDSWDFSPRTFTHADSMFLKNLLTREQRAPCFRASPIKTNALNQCGGFTWHTKQSRFPNWEWCQPKFRPTYFKKRDGVGWNHSVNKWIRNHHFQDMLVVSQNRRLRMMKVSYKNLLLSAKQLYLA